MSIRTTVLAGIGLVLVWLAGCTGMGVTPRAGGGAPAEVVEAAPAPAPGGGPAEAAQREAGARSPGAGGAPRFQGMSIDNPASPLSHRTIYFDFDSAEVKDADREILAAHASYLSANPQVRVILEGHTDERGSREYNIGLGERRAKAVARLLEFMGASPSQIETVSYGEEKPADPGHNEAAWAKNRRVEIVYVMPGQKRDEP